MILTKKGTQNVLVIVKIILLTVAGIAAGHWLGKSSIDSLVDANVKDDQIGCKIKTQQVSLKTT